MHRIDTPTAEADTHGAGKDGFTEGDPSMGVPATALDADYFNAVQEELAAVVEGNNDAALGGGALAKANTSQLLAVMRAMQFRQLGNLLANTTSRTTQFGTDDVYDGAFGGGVHVICGEDGSISTSADYGATWTTQTSQFGGSDDVLRVAWLNNALFIAVGQNAKLSTSPTGATWTGRTSQFTSDTINDLAYGAGAYVVVGNAGKISSSADGATWVARTAGVSSNNLTKVIFADGVFIAVGAGGAMARSTDGTTWTNPTTTFSTSAINGICYDPVLDMFIIVGDGGKIATSTDAGATWTSRTSGTANNLQSVAHNGVVFVATFAAADEPLYSSDGVTWARADADARLIGTSLKVYKGFFVALCSAPVAGVRWSRDGERWGFAYNDNGAVGIVIVGDSSLFIPNATGGMVQTQHDFSDAYTSG